MALTKIDDRGLNTPIDLLDNEKIRFGTGNDLELYHDGSNNFIVGTSNTWIKNSGQQGFAAGGDYQVRCTADGTVELFYDNSKKLETGSGGIVVQGQVAVAGTGVSFSAADSGKAAFGDGDDLQIYHNGNNSYITHDNTGSLYVVVNSGHIAFEKGAEELAKFIPDGACELYYNNVKKFETASYGAQVSGNLVVGTDAGELLFSNPDGYSPKLKENAGALEFYTNNALAASWGTGGNLAFLDNKKVELGTGADLQIYHDGTHSKIHNNTNFLVIETNQFAVNNHAADEAIIKGFNGGAVELYHDNSKKLETTSTGVKVPVATSSHGIAIDAGSGDVYPQLIFNANRSAENNSCGYIVGRWNTADVAAIDFLAGEDTTNKDDGKIGFNTRTSGSGMARRMTIENNGDVWIKPNNKNWSTLIQETHDGKNLAHHVRSYNNGQNSVSVQNVARIRQNWWGWGNYQFLAHVTYYWGSQTTKMVLHGVGTSDNGYSLKTLDEVYTNGSDHRWAGVFTLTSTSTSSPGDSSVRYVDVQFSMPNYTYGTVEVIAQSDYNTGATTDSMGVNSYTLF